MSTLRPSYSHKNVKFKVRDKFWNLSGDFSISLPKKIRVIFITILIPNLGAEVLVVHSQNNFTTSFHLKRALF